MQKRMIIGLLIIGVIITINFINAYPTGSSLPYPTKDSQPYPTKENNYPQGNQQPYPINKIEYPQLEENKDKNPYPIYNNTFNSDKTKKENEILRFFSKIKNLFLNLFK